MASLTPMMAQYRAVKEKYKDCILMFRLGDFYEMFFEDAIEASKILQITLTSRNREKDIKIPMCGVPFHAIDQYLPKLTKSGKKVAICDQLTEPNGKGLVERDVIRIVTPGTTFDENILDKKTNNYVSCVTKDKNFYSFAYADITTGDFKVTEFKNFSEFEEEFSKIRPAELICDKELFDDFKLKELLNRISSHAFPYLYSKEPENTLKNYFEIKSLKIFGLEGKNLSILASGMLYEYLKETQKTDLKHITNIKFYTVSDFMPLDESCIRNLDMKSLISVLDNTMTPMGGRLIRSWLLNPLINKKNIEERLNRTEIFVKNSNLLREIRNELNQIYDIERLLSRLSLGTGNGRDLIAMKESLKIIPKLKNLINGISIFSDIYNNLYTLDNIVELIGKAINDECPLSVRDGGIIKIEYNKELDDLRSISTEGKTFIRDLQQREISRTGISSLKVRFNKVFGYYIEISKTNLSLVPNDYIRKQTLVNAERFITPELKDYEEKVLTAEDKIKELEYELFYSVRMALIKELRAIQITAKSVSKLDVYSTFAFNAEKNNYCKPEILENGNIFIKNGRHPVIEQVSLSHEFVPNDCEMDNAKKFFLITGPNMGGKSTYLRQVALIVLMAQIGSYVPAEIAKICIVDRIFTRVGASDNLIKGESTFMVEMQEASYILNNATEKSLIILDEVGRGTSTYDGVSIAWAISEFIHDKIKSKTLFATHYHELIELADKLTFAKNLSVAVKENEKDGVIFLYKIIEGGIDKSYGIEVAKLAGLPVDVISRARGVLQELETKHIPKRRVSPNQVDMFDTSREHGEVKNLQIKAKMC